MKPNLTPTDWEFRKSAAKVDQWVPAGAGSL